MEILRKTEKASKSYKQNLTNSSNTSLQVGEYISYKSGLEQINFNRFQHKDFINMSDNWFIDFTNDVYIFSLSILSQIKGQSILICLVIP